MGSISNRKKPAVTIVTLPFCTGGAGEVLLSRFLRLVAPAAEPLTVITGEYSAASAPPGTTVINVPAACRTKNFAVKLARQLATQICIATRILQNPSRIVLFYIGTSAYLLPFATAKLSGQQTVLYLSETESGIYRRDSAILGGMGHRVLPPLLRAIETLNCSMADRILAGSGEAVTRFGLGKYSAKLAVCPEYHLDEGQFGSTMPPSQRELRIGFIGRLQEEKGILNFVEALPALLDALPEATVLIGGGGPLSGQVEARVKELGIKARVSIPGWIPREQLPAALNSLRLLVVPSYTETGPYITLEAMGCGTPVLATRAGAINSMLEEGVTGFLLPDNEPPTIAGRIIELLASADLDGVATRAEALVNREYRFKDAVSRIGAALGEV